MANLENQALADPPGRMIGGVLLLGEIASGHESNSNRVSKHHLDSSGGDRSEIEWTKFPLERKVNIHVAERGESIADD